MTTREVVENVFADPRLMAELLDAYPSATLIVDEDVRILFASRAARESLGLQRGGEGPILLQRAGHVLHCLYAQSAAGGCGRTEACQDCVIRNSVQTALRTGAVHRAKAFLKVRNGSRSEDHFFLVSARSVSTDRPMVVLTIEDVSELEQLHRILQICMNCGQVRDPGGMWQRLAVYLKEHADVDLSHGLCPACYKGMYPE